MELTKMVKCDTCGGEMHLEQTHMLKITEEALAEWRSRETPFRHLEADNMPRM